MVCSKISQEDHEKMRSKMLEAVNTFCDQVKSEEEDQVHIGLEDLEISINETLLDTISSHYENNDQTSQEDHEKVRSEMLKALDTFCDKVKSEEENQVHIGLEDMEISIDEAALDTIFAHCENNNQESTPLLPEQQQELRNRVRSRVRPGQKPGPERNSEPEGLQNQSPGAQKTGESFCEWVLRLFQKMLSRLQKTWLYLLAWVKKKLVIFVKNIKFICRKIKNLFCSVAQFFFSLFQF